MSSNIPYNECEDSDKEETKVYKKNFEFDAYDLPSVDQTIEYSIISPTFDFELNEQIKCNLEIYPHGCSYESKEYLSVFLYLDKLDKLPMLIEVEFYILNFLEEKSHNKKTKEIHNFFGVRRFGFEKFLLKKKLNKIKHDSFFFPLLHRRLSFTIGCEILITIDNKSSSKNFKEEEYSTSLIHDISRMFNSSELSDCIIKVDGISMNVHKFMLASRSEVFLSIFNNKDDKFKSNIIEINDFRLEVVKEMLTYIYTGKSPNLNEMAIELLMIATKYNLKELKSMAENILCNSIEITNICDYVEMSEIYTASMLKKCCATFIYENAIDVVESEKWTNIAVKYPLLVNKFLKFFVKKDKSRTNR